ncbi:S8 family serine peptidase [[Brevibacterium] frigoritolerans]|uniref:S8 family serine peptidase n=1 Tax=Peribacillus frigoritolerans TaxID=450367 RepID=A0A941FKC2_9BACI|nr:S8 family serine peptidase [Peribacillus frigoritolerans]
MDFKLEITAPGGQIYSTLNNDEYGMMSGTSMAAPHVSGGSALVLERVDKDFKLEGSARANLEEEPDDEYIKTINGSGSSIRHLTGKILTRLAGREPGSCSCNPHCQHLLS